MEQQNSDLAIEHLDNPDDASSKGSSMGKFNTITSHVIKLIPVKNDNRMAYLSPPINDFSNAKLKKRQSFDKVILHDGKLLLLVQSKAYFIQLTFKLNENDVKEEIMIR